MSSDDIFILKPSLIKSTEQQNGWKRKKILFRVYQASPVTKLSS